MTLRLTDEETEALQAAAEADGVSVQDYARAAIREKMSAWVADRDAFLQDFARANKGLLDRLGQ